MRDLRRIQDADSLSWGGGMSLALTERRLAAIMLADIAGYSALMERDEARTFGRIRALREQVINPKVAEFGGRIIKTTGDGFLAEFPSATAALGCGIAIRRMNFAQEAGNNEADRFHLRVGVNLGDIISDGDDVSGDGVNIAARLEPLAPLDGICVSGAVRDQVREEFGVVLEDLGEQQVKNISRPIRAYRINLANVPVAKPPRRDPKGFQHRVAVFRVASELDVESRFDAMRGKSLSQFVGRNSEIGILLDRWELAKSGQGQAVFVSGEAGIGKSRLLEALMERFQDQPPSRG
jgi:class 3 adenylate cyclase